MRPRKYTEKEGCIHRVSMLSCSLQCAGTSPQSMHKSAELPITLSFGTYVNECRFPLESTKGETTEQFQVGGLGFEVLPCISVLVHTLKRPSSLPVGQGEGKDKAEEVPDNGVLICPYINAISLQKPQQSEETRTGLSAKTGIP